MTCDGGISDELSYVDDEFGPVTGRLTTLYWTRHDGLARATPLYYG
jgi:hypothetical protein